jgi:hypothetical protein
MKKFTYLILFFIGVFIRKHFKISLFSFILNKNKEIIIEMY